MKIKLSKSQWKTIGKKAGWLKNANISDEKANTFLKPMLINDFKNYLSPEDANIMADAWLALENNKRLDFTASFNRSQTGDYAGPKESDEDLGTWIRTTLPRIDTNGMRNLKNFFLNRWEHVMDELFQNDPDAEEEIINFPDNYAEQMQNMEEDMALNTQNTQKSDQADDEYDDLRKRIQEEGL